MLLKKYGLIFTQIQLAYFILQLQIILDLKLMKVSLKLCLLVHLGNQFMKMNKLIFDIDNFKINMDYFEFHKAQVNPFLKNYVNYLVNLT